MKAKAHFDHSGSSFDSFLEEEGIREEIEAIAIKRVVAWQFAQAMREKRKTKQAMAQELKTSRSQLDRLLDPKNTSVSLETIARAAHVLGKRVTISINDMPKPKGKRRQPHEIKKFSATSKEKRSVSALLLRMPERS